MTNDENIFWSFKFHNNRFEPDDQIIVWLAHWISIGVLVASFPVPPFILFWISLFYLFISESLANTRINLIQCFPRLVIQAGQTKYHFRTLSIQKRYLRCSLPSTPQFRSPNNSILRLLFHKVSQFHTKLFTAGRKGTITANSLFRGYKGFFILHYLLQIPSCSTFIILSPWRHR